jgi:hypothetical protein
MLSPSATTAAAVSSQLDSIPRTNIILPIVDCRLPIVNSPLPIADCRLTIDAC